MGHTVEALVSGCLVVVAKTDQNPDGKGREEIRVNAGKPRCEAHSPPTVEGSVSTPKLAPNPTMRPCPMLVMPETLCCCRGTEWIPLGVLRYGPGRSRKRCT